MNVTMYVTVAGLSQLYILPACLTTVHTMLTPLQICYLVVSVRGIVVVGVIVHLLLDATRLR